MRTATTTDPEIEPGIRHSEFSALDWSGGIQVEEDWRPVGNGTIMRQCFYRHARWMGQASPCSIFLTDNIGIPIGVPLIAHAGKENRCRSNDDGFVRRFVAQQTATGYRVVGD